VRVRSELDRQISHIHRTAIPLQPETHLLLPSAIFRQGFWLQIVPLLTHPVAAFAHHPCFSPAGILTWLLSCGLRQSGFFATDLDSLLDMLLEQGVSICPSASTLNITSGFLWSTSSWYQPGLDYSTNILIPFVLLLHSLMVYAQESA